jgi:glucuronate isomerase
MLTECAAMSLDDGLVLQLHAGSRRNHNPALGHRFGPDKGADIPIAMNYVDGLAPLLSRFGNEPRLTIVVYTLDESAYSRELAPLAGHYPALRLGPPWWFHDSPEGIRRYRRAVTETAGFANTVGFNDDARSLLSIPARHDVARRIDAGFLAELVAEHRLTEQEAYEVAEELAYYLARSAFRVPE